MCTESTDTGGRPHGGGECYSFFVDVLGTKKKIFSSHYNIAGKTFQFFTVPKGCEVTIFDTTGANEIWV